MAAQARGARTEALALALTERLQEIIQMLCFCSLPRNPQTVILGYAGVFNLQNIPRLFSAVFPPRTPISSTSWHRWVNFVIKEIKVLDVLNSLLKVMEPAWSQNQNSKLSCATKFHPKVCDHFLTLEITLRLWTNVEGQSFSSSDLLLRTF